MSIPFAVELVPGMIADDTTFAAPGTVEDGSRVRCWRDRWQTIGGWSRELTGIDGVTRAILPWTDIEGDRLIGLGTNTKLYVYTGGTLSDITPDGLAAGAENGVPGSGYGVGEYGMDEYGTERTNAAARTWSLANYGESLMASPSFGGIYHWQNDVETPAAALTNAPDTVNVMLVTAERCVMALGCKEETSGDYNPLCVRWSDFEDPTDWTTASDNNAGEFILSGGGKIIGARLMGIGIAIWTDNAVYFAQATGRTDQPYRFDRIADNHGLIGPNAVAVMGQTAWWVGPDRQFRVWQLGTPPVIVPCPIRNAFKDHIAEGQEAKICASTLTAYDEVWWFYPDSRDGAENSRYLCVNTQNGWWTRGMLDRSAFCDAGVVRYPIGVDPSGDLYFHELGQNANGANLEWYLKTADFYLDEARRHMFVSRVRPDFEQQEGGIALTIETRKYPQAEAKVHDPIVMAEGRGKRDFRISGCVMAFKLSGASNPAFMRMGKLVFDVTATGER